MYNTRLALTSRAFLCPTILPFTPVKNIIPFMLGVVCALLVTVLVLLYQMQGNAMFSNWGVWLLIAIVALRLTRSLLLIKQYVRSAVLVQNSRYYLRHWRWYSKQPFLFVSGWLSHWAYCYRESRKA